VPRATLEDLRGGDAAVNATAVRELLAGKPGAVRDAVLLNAAAALAAFRAAPGPLVDRLADGLAAAGEALDSGAAAAALDRWVAVSQRLSARASS
jgi:anthranilate phosphoribosyltransferase